MVGKALLEGGLVGYCLVSKAFGALVLEARWERLVRLCLSERDGLLGRAGLLSTARHAISWIYIGYNKEKN